MVMLTGIAIHKRIPVQQKRFENPEAIVKRGIVLSKRKDTYVKENQKSFYLKYQLVRHEGTGESDGKGYYGIVVEQYEIRDGPYYERERRKICPQREENKPPTRVSDHKTPYKVADSRLKPARLGRCEISGLSESEEEAEKFLNMIYEGKVVPDSLIEVYDDWMSAFHPRWEDQMGRTD